MASISLGRISLRSAYPSAIAAVPIKTTMPNAKASAHELENECKPPHAFEPFS